MKPAKPTPKPPQHTPADQPAASDPPGAPEPLPQAGGSYTRQPDGSLLPTPAVPTDLATFTEPQKD